MLPRHSHKLQSPNVSQCSSQSVVIACSGSPSTPVAAGGIRDLLVATGISPGKITDLRMKTLQELRELQGLLEQNILTQQEFIEQKQLVLESLWKLTH